LHACLISCCINGICSFIFFVLLCWKDKFLICIRGPKSGQGASRQHTSRPEATPLDFVVRPQSKIDPEEIRARAKQQVQDQRRLKVSSSFFFMHADFIILHLPGTCIIFNWEHTELCCLFWIGSCNIFFTPPLLWSFFIFYFLPFFLFLLFLLLHTPPPPRSLLFWQRLETSNNHNPNTHLTTKHGLNGNLFFIWVVYGVEATKHDHGYGTWVQHYLDTMIRLIFKKLDTHIAWIRQKLCAHKYPHTIYDGLIHIQDTNTYMIWVHDSVSRQ